MDTFVFDPNTIRVLRKKRGYSLGTVALRFKYVEGGHKISRQAISHWELGKHAPSIKSLEILARVFKVHISAFFEIRLKVKFDPMKTSLQKRRTK